MNPKISAIETLIDFDLKSKLKVIEKEPINLKNWLLEFYLRGWKDRDRLMRLEKNRFTIT